METPKKDTDHCELGKLDGALDGNAEVTETDVVWSVGATLLLVEVGKVVVPGVARMGSSVWLGPGTGILE